LVPEIPTICEKDGEKLLKKCEDSCGKVLCMSVSQCCTYFAVCNDRKQLLVWDTTNGWQLTKSWVINRRASALCFTRSSDEIVLADRSGDVYVYSLKEDATDGVAKVPILGHVSLLLDLLLSCNGKFLITCDRDEKIRVSRFPNAYNIESFCLGHSEFVSSLALMPLHPDLLVSSSGDGSIRIWHFETGEERASINVSELVPDANRLAVKKCICMLRQDVLVASYFGCRKLSVFSVKLSLDKIDIYHQENVNFEAEPWDIGFDDKDTLWVAQPIQSEPVVTFNSVQNDDCIHFQRTDKSNLPVLDKINEDWEFFKASVGSPSDIGIMYKQWYDNVQDYLQRKEERLEQKKKKHKK